MDVENNSGGVGFCRVLWVTTVCNVPIFYSAGFWAIMLQKRLFVDFLEGLEVGLGRLSLFCFACLSVG